MGCCASQTVADALQPLAGQEDAAKISKDGSKLGLADMCPFLFS